MGVPRDKSVRHTPAGPAPVIKKAAAKKATTTRTVTMGTAPAQVAAERLRRATNAENGDVIVVSGSIVVSEDLADRVSGLFEAMLRAAKR